MLKGTLRIKGFFVYLAEAVRFELTKGFPLPVFKFPATALYVNLGCYCK